MKGGENVLPDGKMFGLFVDHWEEWIRLLQDGIGHKAKRGEQPRYLCGKGRCIGQHVAFGGRAVEAVARFLQCVRANLPKMLYIRIVYPHYFR